MPIVLETQRLSISRQCDCSASELANYHRRNQRFHGPWSPARDPSWYEEAYVFARTKGEDPNLKFALWEGSTLQGLVTVTGLQDGAFCAGYLGFSLDQQAEGKGLMFEALGALLPHIFDQLVFEGQPLNRLMAAYMPSNARSAKLLARLGFEREGLAKAYLRIAGQWEDHVLTALLNSR